MEDKDKSAESRAQGQNHEPARFLFSIARIVDLVDQLQRSSDQSRPNQNSKNADEDMLARYTRRLACATWVIAIVGILGFGAALLQWDALSHTDKKIGEQVAAMRDQLTLAYPPRLVVTHVSISKIKQPEIIPSFTEGERIEGTAFIVNVGRETAQIKTVDYFPYWREGPLPMHKPTRGTYDEKFREMTISEGMEPFEATGSDVMLPGQIGRLKFTTQVPKGVTSFCRQSSVEIGAGPCLYLVGSIAYLDRLTPPTRRALFFAQRYDASEQRFLPVKDYRAYEGEEQNN